jgi:hypothetical protein
MGNIHSEFDCSRCYGFCTVYYTDDGIKIFASDIDRSRYHGDYKLEECRGCFGTGRAAIPLEEFYDDPQTRF